MFKRVRIHRYVKIIPARAFEGRVNLIYVEFHSGVEKIEEYTFNGCPLLRSVKLLGVKVIEVRAFCSCRGLTDVEVGNNWKQLDTVHSVTASILDKFYSVSKNHWELGIQ